MKKVLVLTETHLIEVSTLKTKSSRMLNIKPINHRLNHLDLDKVNNLKH